MWYLYILRCSDNSFYTGITFDLQKRVDRHNSAKGSKYTKVKLPVELLYAEEFVTKSAARTREIEVKKLGINRKEHLIKYGMGIRFPSAVKVNHNASGLHPSPRY